MTALTITAEQLAHAKEHGNIVVDGVCIPCGPRVAWHHDLDCGSTPLDTPCDLVALTEPCETSVHLKPDRECFDPDCVDGYRRLQLIELCDICKSSAGTPVFQDHCDGCVLAATARVTAVLPIVEEGEDAHHDPDAITLDLLGGAWHGHRAITPPPNTRPGQYVVIVEVDQ